MMVTMSRHWTPEELRYLGEALDDNREPAEIAAALGRTIEAVRQAPAYRTRITSRRRPWTPAETEDLRNMLSKGMSLAEIAPALGRSRDVIRKHPAYKEQVRRHPERWTAGELRYLAENRAAGKSVAEIASVLGRTISSVNNAIPVNGIPPRYGRWSAEETEYLTQALAAGDEPAGVAAMLGRTEAAIKNTSAYRDQIKHRRRSWTEDETRYLLEALASGVTVADITVKLCRNYNSVVCTANKLGVITRKKAFVPDRIGPYDILCAEVPGKARKVLARCRGCARQEWMYLAGLRSREDSGCRRCNGRSRSPAMPRFCTGEQVGYFTVIAVCGPKLGGWKYQVRDNRCGHEKTTLDKPDQPFKGILTVCGCPVREKRDGYICWSWHKDGQIVFVMEHRVFMEQAIGRQLYPDETVHHKNGVRDDNRLENLELWSSSHPSGQRVEDKISWAISLLERYLDDPLSEFVRDPRIMRELLGGKP